MSLVSKSTDALKSRTAAEQLAALRQALARDRLALTATHGKARLALRQKIEATERLIRELEQKGEAQ